MNKQIESERQTAKSRMQRFLEAVVEAKATAAETDRSVFGENSSRRDVDNQLRRSRSFEGFDFF